MKRKTRMRKWFHFLLLIIFFFVLYFLLKFLFPKIHTMTWNPYYVKGSTNMVSLYSDTYEEELQVVRGTKVFSNGKNFEHEGETYLKIQYDNKEYFVKTPNLTQNENDFISETVLYVRTPATIYADATSSKILSFGKKGSAYEITGYDGLKEDGGVILYKIKVGEKEGYISSKYVVLEEASSLENYDHNGTSYAIHQSRGNTLLGGSAANLDYFPVEKPSFENNVMPDEVRALYLNSSVLGSIDTYIEIAKESNMNAFVVDIKDNTAPGYASKVMEEKSPTSYAYAINSFESYQNAIQKLKAEGFYVIGRITTFKDTYYIKDHNEDAILDTTTSAPYYHDGSYWPSAFKRSVWEYNVELAKEAVREMGFHEIQFDYVRFPDRTYSDEKNGIINFQNQYEEEKAQAIQNFLRYACDEIHKEGAYVSADVFGESAHNYVTGYGQYWGAISNVVDVISGMPYPELFNKYEYGFTVPVWTVPYDLMKTWATNYVQKQQALVPTPAIVRTWIQAYDATWKNPAAIYDSDMVSKEIQGLYDSGFRSGFITWNGGSSISKYRSLSSAFKKEY